jgi:hypothetical protein
VDLVVFVFN